MRNQIHERDPLVRDLTEIINILKLFPFTIAMTMLLSLWVPPEVPSGGVGSHVVPIRKSVDKIRWQSDVIKKNLRLSCVNCFFMEEPHGTQEETKRNSGKRK